MKIFRKPAAGALVLGAVLSMSAPASQAEDKKGVWNCDHQHVCVWEHANFNGYKNQFSGFNHYSYIYTPQLNRKVSSWMNANNYTVMWLGEWRGQKAVGGAYIPAGYRGTNLQDDNFNDRAQFVARDDWHW